jgi:hypothetical protein
MTKRKHDDPTHRDEERELLALDCLKTLLTAARDQNPIAFRENGGHEAIDFFYCVLHGTPRHPATRGFLKRMKQNAHRPPPGLSDIDLRRHVLLCVAALERSGMKVGQARKFTSDKLASALRGRGPSDEETIRRWQRQSLPFGPQDEETINHAIQRAWGSAERIVEYFAGIILWGHDLSVPARLIIQQFQPDP